MVCSYAALTARLCGGLANIPTRIICGFRLCFDTDSYMTMAHTTTEPSPPMNAIHANFKSLIITSESNALKQHVKALNDNTMRRI